jgi:hypothetical protein
MRTGEFSKRFHGCLGGFLLLLAAVTGARGDLLETWHWRAPLPQGNSLYGAAQLNGNYFAFGELGTILTSADGTNWQQRISGTSLDLRAGAYGAGKYVIVGDWGTVLTSANCVDWTPQYAGTFYSLKAVTYSGSQFVAVGEESTILTSPDGVIWTQRATGNWTLWDVLFANGVYVAAGGIRASANVAAMRVLLISADGVAWTPRVLEPDGPFTSLAYGQGGFVAVAATESYLGNLDLWRSGNGADWKYDSVLSAGYYPWAHLIYAHAQWVLTAAIGMDYYSPYYGSGSILVSDDLTHWNSVGQYDVQLRGVAANSEGFVVARADGAFLVSGDGLTWSSPLAEPSTMSAVQDLKHLAGQFCLLGYGEIAFSPDGTTWTNRMAVTNTDSLRCITHGSGLYVAGSDNRTIWVSADGFTWTNPAPSLSDQLDADIVSIASGNGVFVGVSGYDAQVVTSPDGTNWLVQALNTNESASVYLRDVTFGNGRFVAVSGDGWACSADGTNWLLNTTNTGLQAVTAGNGHFVAVGYNLTATSTDGTNWAIQSHMWGDTPLSAVEFGQGVFVATGYNWNSASPLRTESPIWVSTDGVNWARRASNTPRQLTQVAFGNGTFVIAGEAGAVLQSDPMVVLELSDSLPPTISISGPMNRSYRIECRDDMLSNGGWETLTTLTNSCGPFVESTWTNGNQRFYRAVLLP